TDGLIDIASSWHHLPAADLAGVILIVGAPDTGKSTLARYLHGRLAATGRRVAFLDGDPGQSTLGPPATMTLAMGEIAPLSPQPWGELDSPQPWGELDSSQPWGELDSPRSRGAGGAAHRWFVGATSPRGHMLPVLVGAGRLVEAARAAGAEVLVYDTSGLVDPAQGGLSLKLAKIDLLRPAAVIAIQREDELEPLLAPLRRSQHTRLFELTPSPAVTRRDAITRREHRAAQFGRYFAGARLLDVDFGRLAVLPEPNFAFNQLIALEDAAGFTLGLGIVRETDLDARQVTLLTPLACSENSGSGSHARRFGGMGAASAVLMEHGADHGITNPLAGVDALRLGDLAVEPWTWRDQRVGE
ncbi:MAG: Clp1/GlmU family protein, partial [Chloroflexi bacterium]|nr:Clp1/GlmU family protein [Chloroflexota bacterium]